MKKLLSGGLILIIVIGLTGILCHKTTLRYLNENNASIRPDRQLRIINLPTTLKLPNFRLKQVYYSPQQHRLIARYQLTSSPLTKVKSAKYIGVSFQPTTTPIYNHNRCQLDPNILNRDYNGQASARDTINVLIGDRYNHYHLLSANYPAVNVRDPSIMKQGDRYYIIYTRGLMYTTDFTHWHQVKWHADRQFDLYQEWAPEFVKSNNGKSYVVMAAASKKSPTEHGIYLTNFKHGHVGRHWVRLTGNFPTNVIDPNINYYHGQYYLFLKNEANMRLMLGTSTNLTGPYTIKPIKADLSQFQGIEGPEALFLHGRIILYFDTYSFAKNRVAVFHTLHYIEGNVSTKHWSKARVVHSNTLLRHGQFILNK